MPPKTRLAILPSHPIPYLAPLFRSLASRPELELLVIFGDDYGARPQWSGWGVANFTWGAGVTEGYPHVFLPNWSRRPHPSAFAGRLNPGLPLALRRFRPDAVLHVGYGDAYRLLGLASTLFGRARRLYLADSARLPTSDLRGRAKRLVLERVLYPSIDAFLTVGARNREHYRAFGVPERKLFPFPFAVDGAHFRAEAERLAPRRAELRERFGVPPGATCVGFAGRLAPEKNVAEIVRGVAGTADGFLLIVGTGPEQPALERLARELLPGRHGFAGFLNQDRLGEAYTAMDVFTLASSHEPWGLVLNEAMCFGVPIVVSDTVGAGPDLVVPGVTGHVYPLGDVAKLAQALSSLAADLARDHEARRAAVLAHVAKFSCEAQAAGVMRALDDRARS